MRHLGKFVIMTAAELDTIKGGSYSDGAMEGHRQGVLAGKLSAGGRTGGFATSASHWKALAAEKDARIAQLVQQLQAYHEDPDPLPAPVGYQGEIVATDGDANTPAEFAAVAAQVEKERATQVFPAGQDPRD